MSRVRLTLIIGGERHTVGFTLPYLKCENEKEFEGKVKMREEIVSGKMRVMKTNHQKEIIANNNDFEWELIFESLLNGEAVQIEG